MAISNEHHLQTPFFLIGFRSIETEICRPCRFGYELNGGEWVAGPKRGSGGQGSLGGRRSRCVRHRAQRGIIAYGCGHRDTGRMLAGGMPSEAHSREYELVRGDLVQVFASTKFKRGP